MTSVKIDTLVLPLAKTSAEDMGEADLVVVDTAAGDTVVVDLEADTEEGDMEEVDLMEEDMVGVDMEVEDMAVEDTVEEGEEDIMKVVVMVEGHNITHQLLRMSLLIPLLLAANRLLLFLSRM